MIWGGGLSNLPYPCWGARLFGRVGPWQTRVQMAGDTVLGVPARGSTALGSRAGGGCGRPWVTVPGVALSRVPAVPGRPCTRALRTWQRALQRLPPAARQALHAVRRRVPVPPPPPLPVRRCAVRRGAGMAGRGGDPHRLRPPGRGGARRDLTAAHIESFNYAVSEGVYRAVQVWGPKRGGVGVARPVSAISPCCFLRAVAGSLPGGVRAEGQPGDFGSGGGVHRSPRRAGGDGVPGEEGVPSGVPRPPQHLPRPDRCKWPPRRCTCGQQSQLSPCCIFLCALVKNPVPVSSAVGWFLRGLSLVECVVSVNDELTVETSFQTEFPTAPTSAALLFLGTTAVLFALLSDLPCS